MPKIYFLRHQAAGLLAEYPFAEPPTEEQVNLFARVLRARHGDAHPKTREPYWLRVVTVDLLDHTFKPPMPGPVSASAAESLAALAEPQVTARGTVTNP